MCPNTELATGRPEFFFFTFHRKPSRAPPPAQDSGPSALATSHTSPDGISLSLNPRATPEDIAKSYLERLATDPAFWEPLLKTMERAYPNYECRLKQGDMDRAAVLERIRALTGFRLHSNGVDKWVSVEPVVKVLDYASRCPCGQDSL